MHQAFLKVLASCLLLSTWALADEHKDPPLKEPVADEVFVLKASENGLAEVNHGALAANKAHAPEVKSFGQRMVKDHGLANKELIAIADARGYKVAPDMGPKHQAMQEKLIKLDGLEFDRAYMKHMVEGHVKAVALFQAKARDAKDESLKGFAAKTLPVLQDHLKQAKEIHAKIKGDGH